MRNNWYPLLFSEKLTKDNLHAVELCGQPIVLFRDASGTARCLEDACAHRSAPLSLGTLRDGRLECMYHGWQFAGDGRCVHIPTLSSSERIPKAACVNSQPVQEFLGMIWVWSGDVEAATPRPSMAAVEEDVYGKPGWAAATLVRDVDVHHTLLTENLLDPSHVYFVHDQTIAHRKDASPLGVELRPATHGFVITHSSENRRNMALSTTEFHAPTGVRIEFEFMPGKHFVQTSYCIPVGRRRVRFLFRAWRDFGADDPATQTKMQTHAEETFEQDLALLAGLQQRLDAGYKPYVTPVREDQACVAFRRWYDEAGQGI